MCYIKYFQIPNTNSSGAFESNKATILSKQKMEQKGNLQIQKNKNLKKKENINLKKA